VNLILLLALLVGTQIGLSDGLILPTLVADHGQGSCLAVYTVLKLLFILPVLQAELVAGRLYRVTPFEFSFSILNNTTTRVLFGILLTAIILVMATNLFNTSWALMFGFDGLQGDLLSLKPLDQNLYWFAQNQDISRIMILVVVQGVLLVMLGGLAWRVSAAIFLAVVPLVALFIVLSLPSIGRMLLDMAWPALSVEDLLVAMQHALTSSMAGLLIWYVVGTNLSDRLPTGRVIIGVQAFDVLYGMAMLAISWQWISAQAVANLDVGTLLRALTASLSDTVLLPFPIAVWLFFTALVGSISSLPLLLLVTQERHVPGRRWLLMGTIASVVALSGVLVYSHDPDSPLIWYGKPVYHYVQQLSQGVIIPFITASIALWIGWVVWPNRVLLQVNPHGGLRYFLWRLVLKFVVPLVLGLVFVRATVSLIAIDLYQALACVCAILLIFRLYYWVKNRALLPRI